MPNDVPDWTAQTKSNLMGGISGLNLGDVGAPALAFDQVTETLGGTAGFGGWNNIVLASFKAAAASTIAKVGALGAIVVGTATSVSPLFGQAPTAGNLLVAWVTAGSADPTTNAAGWVKAVTNNFNGQFSAIWYKPNAAGGDAAPVFTVGAGSNLMSAQLGEFSGAATVSPLDQTATGGGITNPITVAATATDVGFGDLVLSASRWIEAQAGTAVFTDTVSNGGTVVQAGSAQVGDIANRACNFTYAIIPAATVAQPLGVADWDYDVQGVSLPAVGSVATVTLAAVTGKTYRLASWDASIAQTAAAAGTTSFNVNDGVTSAFYVAQGVDGTAGHSVWAGKSGLANRFGVGNHLIGGYLAGLAGIQEAVGLAAYLR